MNAEELCKKRLHDLANQAYQKDIVLFSDFLTLNEIQIYQMNKASYPTNSTLFGGYELAERQMVAFIPDALYYEWNFPFQCICLQAKYPKYAENLTHRDVLGTLMGLGIERDKIGDILSMKDKFYFFATDNLVPLIIQEVTRVKHTDVELFVLNDYESINSEISFDVKDDVIASNRIDCIIAKAYHFSRSQASESLLKELVFCNGKCVTDCNYSCKSSDIISVRGKGKFRFESDFIENKKGKIKVRFNFYK